MKLKLGLLAALVIAGPLGIAGEPNAKIADVIAQIETRRTEKTAAEAKAAQARAVEEAQNGGHWGRHGGGDKKD